MLVGCVVYMVKSQKAYKREERESSSNVTIISHTRRQQDMTKESMSSIEKYPKQSEKWISVSKFVVYVVILLLLFLTK